MRLLGTLQLALLGWQQAGRILVLLLVQHRSLLGSHSLLLQELALLLLGSQHQQLLGSLQLHQGVLQVQPQLWGRWRQQQGHAGLLVLRVLQLVLCHLGLG